MRQKIKEEKQSQDTDLVIFRPFGGRAEVSLRVRRRRESLEVAPRRRDVGGQAAAAPPDLLRAVILDPELVQKTLSLFELAVDAQLQKNWKYCFKPSDLIGSQVAAPMSSCVRYGHYSSIVKFEQYITNMVDNLKALGAADKGSNLVAE